MDNKAITGALENLLGPGKVVSTATELLFYSSDMYPRTQIMKLAQKQPEHRPAAVCFPETVEDVVRVVTFCLQNGIPLVPYAGGSGVCGATLTEQGGVVLDVKRMSSFISLDTTTGTAVVEAGIMGERLEERLNASGYTMGHFPSSIRCSTAGGWVACRSAGQFSSRYGKIEDLTVGLEVVLPDGQVVGLGVLGDGHPKDPVLQLFAGSEGTLGVITKTAFRVEPLPAALDLRGFAFLSLDDAVTAMRRVMQSGVRPTVMRLYDPLDSLMAGFHRKTAHGDDIDRATALLSGARRIAGQVITELNEAALRTLLVSPQWANLLAEAVPARPLLILGVQGDKADISHQWEEVRKLVEMSRGEDLGPEPGQSWLKRRYAVSYKQSKVFAAGAFVDTMEVATVWENLLPMYRAVTKAMNKEVFIMAHFSHAYREGCSIYFTFAGYGLTQKASISRYRKAWKNGMETIIRCNGTITHHHGVGVLKRPWLDRECPGGKEAYGAAKAALDPANIMNPGKLYVLD